MPVVLEMLPWYCSRVVLDLRPADLSKKMAWLRRETYFRTAHALLDELRTHLEHGPSERVERLREVGDEICLDSIPTESRTSAASTCNGEPAADACVIWPGCSMSDSTAPSDSASVNSSVRRTTSSAAASPPAQVNETIPPKSRICFAAAAWPGWSGSCGYSTRSTVGWPTRRSTIARAFAQCRSMRTASVFSPRSTR